LKGAIDTPEEAVILLYKIWNMSKSEINKTMKSYDCSQLGFSEVNGLVDYLHYKIDQAIMTDEASWHLMDDVYPNINKLFPKMVTTKFINNFAKDNIISMIKKTSESTIQKDFFTIYCNIFYSTTTELYQIMIDNTIPINGVKNYRVNILKTGEISFSAIKDMFCIEIDTTDFKKSEQ
jgi:hypothetical protein